MNSKYLLDSPKKFRDPETASIDMLRQASRLPKEHQEGLIQRVYDEELSLVAEALQGYINIPFDYYQIDGQLVAANGESLTDINASGLEYYSHKSEQDKRYEFMLKRAIYEYQESLKANELANDGSVVNTIITISPYPEEAEKLYGKQFVESLGFHTDTKRAMLRAVQKTENGVRMYTRAVDESNLSIWNKILPKAYQVNNTDELLGKTMYFTGNAVNILDDIQNQYELECGITNNIFARHDIWLFLQKKQDLIEYFKHQLNELSKGNLQDQELKLELNKLRRDFWSAIKISHEKHINGENYMNNSSASEIFNVSGAITNARRESFIGCGMAINPIEQLSTQDTLQEIFGQKGILKCVKCPFCNKTVDAKVSKSTIECLNKSCGAKLDKNSGKRIDKNDNKKNFIDYILDLLFDSDNQKSQKNKTVKKA